MIQQILNNMILETPEEGALAQSHEHKERTIKVRRFRQRTNQKFKAQSLEANSQMGLEENQTKDISTEKLTTFDDGNAKHTEQSDENPYSTLRTMVPVELDAFLKRPIILGTYNWASTDALGASLGSWIFPNVLFTATMQAKLEKIAFWKPKIEITIRMNGTPMHYGKLVFAWIPQAQQLNASYTSSYFSMYSNHWTQVSASANQSTTIIVPFTHYKEMCTVGYQLEDFFTLYCRVGAPLNSVNGAPPSVNFTMFARVLETGLTGYNFTTNWVAQSLGMTESEEKTTGGKVVSSSLRVLSDAVKNFTWLPVLGQFANSTSLALKSIGNIANWFGLNVPINSELTHPMQIRQPRLLQIEDCPTSMCLGIKPVLSVAKDYSMVNDTVDSSAILHFIQRPALMFVGTVTSAVAAGTVIFSTEVTPSQMHCEDYNTPLSPTSFVGTPIQFMSRFFYRWRGGIRFHISFIASHFHSLRVRLSYIPFFLTTAGIIPAPTETEGVDLVNTIIDISEETDYSFTIPYCQESDWLETAYTLEGTMSKFNCNGVIKLQVINPLTSGASSVNPIYFQVFVSAANDFQFALPNGGTVQNLGMFKAQSFSVSSCEIPSSSMTCLRDKDYPVFGGEVSGRTDHGVFMPVEITGIKQVTNMIAPTISRQAVSTTAASSFDYTQLEDNFIALAAGTNFANYMYNMTTVFRYQRGGTRIVARSRDFDLTCQINCSYANAVTSATPGQFTAVGAGSDWNTPTQANIVSAQLSSAQFVRQGQCPIDITIPWYYKYKCALTKNHIIAANSQPQPSIKVNFNWWTALSNNNLLISLGGADDFILGHQLGIPVATTTLP